MGGHGYRTRPLVVLTAILLASTLTSCGNTTVAGHGKPVAAGKSAGTDTRRLLRKPSDTPFGDPVTVDLCAAVPAAQLSKFGSPAVHSFQSAGRCYYNITTASASWQLDTDIVSSADFRLDKGYTTSSLRYGVVYRFPVKGGVCRRAFSVANFVLDTVSVVFDGSVPVRQQCAAIEVLVAAEAEAYFGSSTPAPRRVMPTPTFTRFDQCKLLDTVDRITDLANFGDAYTLDEGGGCGRSDPTGDNYVAAQVVIITDEHESATQGRMVTVSGHRIEVSTEKGGCEALVGLGRIASSGSREYLDIDYTTASPPTACSVAAGVAAAMLDAAGQR